MLVFVLPTSAGTRTANRKFDTFGYKRNTSVEYRRNNADEFLFWRYDVEEDAGKCAKVKRKFYTY